MTHAIKSIIIASSSIYEATNIRAGIAQLVERNLAKVEVASSRLVSRSILITYLLIVLFQYAGIAQLVERNLAKVEVASSRLVSRSSLISDALKCGNSSVGRAQPCQG